MNGHTLACRRAFDALRDEHPQYEAALSLGLTRSQAIGEVVHRRVPEALIPGLDQVRTAGVVTLPGAFIGVLLGGGSPAQAAAAQVLVLVGIMAAQTRPPSSPSTSSAGPCCCPTTSRSPCGPDRAAPDSGGGQDAEERSGGGGPRLHAPPTPPPALACRPAAAAARAARPRPHDPVLALVAAAASAGPLYAEAVADASLHRVLDAVPAGTDARDAALVRINGGIEPAKAQVSFLTEALADVPGLAPTRVTLQSVSTELHPRIYFDPVGPVLTKGRARAPVRLFGVEDPADRLVVVARPPEPVAGLWIPEPVAKVDRRRAG